MKPETKNWLGLAKESFESSNILSKHAQHPLSVYHLCQAIEYLLKGARVEISNQIAHHSHNLENLGKKSGLKFSTRQYQTLADLFKHFQRVRYRDISKVQYNTKAKVKPILSKGQKLYLWILDQLKNH